MPSSNQPGSAPDLPVRYYPRRIGRAPLADRLSPGQALHLPHDPARAALARRTAERRVWTETAAAPAAEHITPAPPPPTPGWWARLWRRLTGRE